MSAQILDGKALAASIKKDLAARTAARALVTGGTPSTTATKRRPPVSDS